MNKTSHYLKLFTTVIFLIVFCILFPSSVLADTSPRGCETNTTRWAFFCNWNLSKSWSNLSAGSPAACVVESTTACPANPTGGAWSFSCNSNSCVLTCSTPTYTKCGSTCTLTVSPPPTGCFTYDTCNACCSTCLPGYSKVGTCGTCVQATLNLGVLSVGPTSLINGSNTSSLMYINSTGVSIGTSTIPASTALNVVGATMFSENLSMIHNKSIKVDNANGNTTLLIGNYGDGQGFGYGASTTRTASLAVEGDVKANRLCIKEDCRAEWSDIQGTSYWTASSTYIYNNNSGNVGIGDTEPGSKLSVNGNIAGSESLLVYENGTIMGNLGIGNAPSYTNITFPQYVDLSGNNNVSYISRTASVTAAMIASENGVPSGANFGYSGQQMALGSLSSHPINFITGATSKMFLSADGKLGIGTTSPASALHIYPQNNIEGLTIVSSNYSPLVITNSSSVNLFRVDEIGRTRSSAYCDIDGNNCFNPGLLGWGTASFFATVTVATYTGNNGGTGGYAHAHELCNTKLVGTHVCSSEEILNTIKLKKTMPQEDVWIFAGPPGYVASVNDCEARSSAATGKYGTYWQGPDSGAGYPLGRGLLATCDSLLKLACCY